MFSYTVCISSTLFSLPLDPHRKQWDTSRDATCATFIHKRENFHCARKAMGYWFQNKSLTPLKKWNRRFLISDKTYLNVLGYLMWNFKLKVLHNVLLEYMQIETAIKSKLDLWMTNCIWDLNKIAKYMCILQLILAVDGIHIQRVKMCECKSIRCWFLVFLSILPVFYL